MPPVLRLARPDDAAAVRAIYAPFCDTPVSFEATPPSIDEVRQRILHTLDRFPWLVAADGDAVLGYAYGRSFRDRIAYQWSCEVSVYVDSARHRGGVGRALYTALFRVLVLQGYANAYAGVTLPNPASAGLHEALGFTPVGVYRRAGYKLGAWHDVGWWQLELRPPPSDPAPPTPLPELLGSPGWAAALAAGQARLRD